MQTSPADSERPYVRVSGRAQERWPGCSGAGTRLASRSEVMKSQPNDAPDPVQMRSVAAPLGPRHMKAVAQDTRRHSSRPASRPGQRASAAGIRNWAGGGAIPYHQTPGNDRSAVRRRRLALHRFSRTHGLSGDAAGVSRSPAAHRRKWSASPRNTSRLPASWPSSGAR
jgi:hypothetical protein